jgi:hypothetical protein
MTIKKNKLRIPIVDARQEHVSDVGSALMYPYKLTTGRL